MTTNELRRTIIVRLIILISVLLISSCGVGDSMREVSKNDPVKYARVVAADNGCLGCHSVNVTVVGPAWKMVAKRYQNQPQARAQLIAKIKKGGKGNWNDITNHQTMPGYKDSIPEEDIEALVDYILSL